GGPRRGRPVQAEPGAAGHRPPRLPQGGPLPGGRGQAGAGGPGDVQGRRAGGRRRRGRGHGAGGRVGSLVPARGDRPGRRDRRDRGGGRGVLPRGRVRGRLAAAVAAGGGRGRAAVRPVGARGDVDLLRPAQVRVRTEGGVGGALRRPGDAAAGLLRVGG